jgi:hypothetical protein
VTANAGVFRPLRHQVAENARRWRLHGPYATCLGLAGRAVYLAECGSPCWPVNETDQDAAQLPQCETCTPSRHRLRISGGVRHEQ